MTSTIKVDNIQNQCGGAVVTKCGATTTISGSVVKADDIQAADGGNLINQCGTTITLGASGDTINLASGASQTGFGRTGTVDWQTGDIKTATFTASNGEGYFCNTTSSAFTVNLPAGSAGAIVSVQDYNNTFDSNPLTISPNGSEKINGGAGNIALTTEGEGLTLVYIDGTVGWRSIQDSAFSDIGTNFVAATGGTVTTSGDFKIHTFTGPGTFTVTAGGSPAGSDTVDYLVVAGGGNGGTGGGGAGGYRESSGAASGCYTRSPLGACVSALPVTAQGYPITVGAGGGGNAQPGSNSVFSTITSTGGGGGSGGGSDGGDGGSGGGVLNRPYSPLTGHSGNTPPVSPPQGNPGGDVSTPSSPGGSVGSGGGGATAAGGDDGGAGGAGATSSINASPTTRAGGGGAGGPSSSPNNGGSGGGGPGSAGGGTDGTANTGGGGGGGYSSGGGGGGSGIVIIRYKFQ